MQYLVFFNLIRLHCGQCQDGYVSFQNLDYSIKITIIILPFCTFCSDQFLKCSLFLHVYLA